MAFIPFHTRWFWLLFSFVFQLKTVEHNFRAEQFQSIQSFHSYQFSHVFFLAVTLICIKIYSNMINMLCWMHTRKKNAVDSGDFFFFSVALCVCVWRVSIIKGINNKPKCFLFFFHGSLHSYHTFNKIPFMRQFFKSCFILVQMRCHFYLTCCVEIVPEEWQGSIL